MAFYGVGLDVKVKELNLQFKMAIQAMGGLGIRSLKHVFRRMDFNGNKKLDAQEFEEALKACKYSPSLLKYQAVPQEGRNPGPHEVL